VIVVGTDSQKHFKSRREIDRVDPKSFANSMLLKMSLKKFVDLQADKRSKKINKSQPKGKLNRVDHDEAWVIVS
jgi:hypothetical protein